MILLYNIGIFLYSLLIHFASVFNEKARFFVRGRKHWKTKLRQQIEPNADYIWIHSASLGEFEQGRPVIEEIKKQFPSYKIVLTFFSPSGFEIRKNYEHAAIICYLPLDTKRNAQTFVDLVQPQKAFFIKYEFWYHYIQALQQKNIPLYLISGIFRKEQQFFKNTLWSNWFKKMLSGFEHFFVQNETSGKLLENAGYGNYSVCGDTRFDRVEQITSAAKEIPIIKKFKGNSKLIIAGSTWKADEELLIEFINKSNEKYIIAPHEVSKTNINRIHQLLKKPAVSFSKISENDIQDKNVLIIDSIGLLSSIYRYGDIAYIGGGFGVGIHNILEAATFGMPVIFGPKFEKFKEAVDLVNEQGAFSITNFTQLSGKLEQLLKDKILLNNSAEIARIYVEKNVGATKFIIKKVFNTNSNLD